MRSYIFPKSEVKILKAFLDEGVKLDGFRDVKYHILKHHKRIRGHYRLMHACFSSSPQNMILRLGNRK